VAREKAQAVKKNGLLELVGTRESVESIGGLDALKEWLLKRRNPHCANRIYCASEFVIELIRANIPGRIRILDHRGYDRPSDGKRQGGSRGIR